MNNPTHLDHCPTPQTLAELLLGNYNNSDRELIEEHFRTCDQCARFAVQLSPEDNISLACRSTSGIEAPFTQTAEEDSAVTRLIKQSKQACSQLETLCSNTQRTTPIAIDPDASVRSAVAGPLEFLSPAQRPDELGRLDHYRVLTVLGRGGMGTVFSAEDIRLRRPVALKVMLPSVAQEQSSKERFLREAQSAASIQHDNIISIYQVGEALGIPFIAMPLLSGQSLRACLERQGKLPQIEAVRIGYQVALGLSAAHAGKLIHRDIKPDNIWLEAETNRVKILDFGLVRPTSNDLSITQSGIVLGTPRYMAPEQAMGESIDHRTDLFSLGSVLYHLLTGRTPFEGPTLAAILVNLVNKDPTPIRDLIPNIDTDLVTLIGQLMAKQPSDRPAAASDVSARLQTILERLKQQIAPSIPESNKLMQTQALQFKKMQITNQPISLARQNQKITKKTLLTLAAASCAWLLLATFVITIRDKEGIETIMRVPSGTAIDIETAPGSNLNIREEPLAEGVGEQNKATDSPQTASDTASKTKHSLSQEQTQQILGWYTNKRGRTLTVLPDDKLLRAVFDWSKSAPCSVGEIRLKNDEYIFWQPNDQQPLTFTKDSSTQSIETITVLQDIKFEKSVSYRDIIGKFKSAKGQTMSITDKDGQLYCSIDWANNAPQTNGYIRVNGDGQTILAGYKWKDELTLKVVDKELESITLINILFHRQPNRD